MLRRDVVLGEQARCGFGNTGSAVTIKAPVLDFHAGGLSIEEVLGMCDYSLHGVATRPARVGDKLKTVQFENSITRGFAAVEQPSVAVCLLPGTELVFESEVEFEGGLSLLLVNWSRSGKIYEKVARFRQVHMDKPHVHHDALEFPGGVVVLLTRLVAGQTATVLQLPVSQEKARGAARGAQLLESESVDAGRE
jgi:hypothetical protein